MKKYILLLISVSIMIISFINGWFRDSLFDTLFIFSLLIDLVILVSYITCLVFSIIRIIKDKEFINLITLGILIVTVILVIFFPFRICKTKIECKFYEKERVQIINMIKNGKLKDDGIGNIELPNKYKKISSSGKVYLYQNEDENVVVGFWIYRGILSSTTTELIYSTGGEELIKNNKIWNTNPIENIIKLEDNWFYVITNH